MNAPEPTVPPVPVRRRTVLLVTGILAVAALAAYRNTFTAPFVFDDAGSITENSTLRSLWPPHLAWSPPPGGSTVSGRPLLNFSFALNHAISGDAVWSYHAGNLAIHFLAACALFGVVRRTLNRPRCRARFGAAALPLAGSIAALWLLHPLQTEAVTYVSQRAESLAGLLALLTLYAFVRGVESPRPARAAGWRAVSWLGCLAGMATKEIMVAVPLLVLLHDAIFVAGGVVAAWRQRGRYYLALAATWVLLAVLVAGNRDRGGTAGIHAELTPLLYLQTQCHAIALYLKLCFWPHPLVFDYGLRVVRSFAEAWPQAVLLGGLLTGTLLALARRSANGFAGAWFFGILAPSSSIVPVASQTIAEHRLYLPLAAVVTLAVTAAYAALGRRSLLLWPVLAIALGWLTFERNRAYRSELALWRDTVAKAPQNPRAHYNLAVVYSQQGRFAEAIAEDEAALAFDESWLPDGQTYGVHNKLGFDLAQLGRLEEAVTQYRAALRLNPAYALAHLNLARALVRLDRPSEAIRPYEEALRLNGGEAAIEAELGDALLHAGRPAEAIARIRAVLQVAPSASGFNHLAYVLLTNGHGAEAIAAYRDAVRLDARDAEAWMGLGYALIATGRAAEAIAPCAEAVKLQPDSADAQNTLGIAYAKNGRIPDALACFEQSLRLNPAAADAHTNLGNALAALGRNAEALAHYREALRLNPNYQPARDSLEHELRAPRRPPDTPPGPAK